MRSPGSVLMIGVLIATSVEPLHTQEAPVSGRAEEVQAFGGVDGPVWFTHIAGVGAIGDTLLVGQSARYGVALVSKSGRSLGFWGRRGGGPGEYLAIHAQAVIGDTLVLVDGFQRRITYVDANGEVLFTRPRPDVPAQPPLSWTGFYYPAVAGRLVMSSSFPVMSASGDSVFPLILVDDDGLILDSLPSALAGDRGVEIVRPGRSVMFLKPIHAGAHWGTSPDGRWFGSVTGTRDGVLVARVDLLTLERSEWEIPVAAVRIPESMVDSVARSYLGAQSGERSWISLDEYKEELDLPERAWVRHMQVLNDGNVWFRQPEVDASRARAWHVVNPARQQHGIVDVPADVQVLWREGTELWGRRFDSLGVAWLVKMRITRD